MGRNKDLGLEDLQRMHGAYVQSRLLFMAVEMGVFDAIGADALTAEEVASRLGCSTPGMRRLMDGLVAVGLLEKESDSYRVPFSLKGYLLSDSPESMAAYIRLGAFLWKVWDGMDEVVRTGRPRVEMMELLSSDERLRELFMEAMAGRAREGAREIARVVDLSRCRSMLDVGSGPGTYSLIWMKMHGGLRSTLVDIPPVVEVARRNIEAADLGERADYLAGDFIGLDFGRAAYDLVLLANVLQMHGPETNVALIAKAYEALRPGGLVVIHGFMLDESGTEPLEAALFNLSISAITPSGAAYPKATYLSWLSEAGFRNPRSAEIKAVPSTVLWAEKTS